MGSRIFIGWKMTLVFATAWYSIREQSILDDINVYAKSAIFLNFNRIIISSWLFNNIFGIWLRSNIIYILIIIKHYINKSVFKYYQEWLCKSYIEIESKFYTWMSCESGHVVWEGAIYKTLSDGVVIKWLSYFQKIFTPFIQKYCPPPWEMSFIYDWYMCYILPRISVPGIYKYQRYCL